MRNLAFIDPAVLIWDVDDFGRRPSSYWSLASDAIDLFSVIESAGIRAVLRQGFFDVMLSSFPAEHLDHGKHELRDFSNVVYGFLAKINLHEDCYLDGVIDRCRPDLRARMHFTTEIRNELNSLLKFVSENSDKFVFFSHECVLGAPRVVVSIEVGADIVEIDCLASIESYFEYRNQLLPIYEENEKHDSLCGFGSKLPDCLDHNDLQALLIAASPVNYQKVVCIYSLKANRYIVFRRHFSNRYHAYPIAVGELSRMGINSSDVLQA